MLPYFFVNVTRIAGCRNENQHFLKLRSPRGLLLWLLITASYSHLLRNHSQRDFLFIHHAAPYKANSWLVQTSPRCGNDVREFMFGEAEAVCTVFPSIWGTVIVYVSHGGRKLWATALQSCCHKHSIVVVGVFFSYYIKTMTKFLLYSFKLFQVKRVFFF